ncbi:ArsR/SmtB family transcription factor [Dolosicoccus paucivorans]|uniref:ArsR/SmtB family transcription factor n=1 Tax=Dolosicoccus paucivorans TaxID=84521 RepID=UPI000881C3B6|nr:metalloregulator ArsR/SmtB family transcription factor [Dolosicoccus paucivorans]SDI68686.1 transcriptional regulator, ArsR family [Dolosicoccus paucivorans]
MQKIDVNSQLIQKHVSVIKVLSHPIRFSIALFLYRNGKMNVGAIQEGLDLPQSTVSQHISKMREAGIVKADRQGTKIYYTLSNDIAIKVLQTLS